MKQVKKWNRVMLGMYAPKIEIARFAATGDAYSYAKELIKRDGINSNVWIIPAEGMQHIVRKEVS